MWEVVEHEGKLAVTLGFSPDWREPQESRTLWVSPVRAADAPHLVGLFGGQAAGNEVVFHRLDGVPVRFVTDGWPKVIESRPVPKPRARGPWAWWGMWHRL